MKKKETNPNKNTKPSLLIISKEDFEDKLNIQILSGIEIFNKEVRNISELKIIQNEFNQWSDFNSELLKISFNNEDNEYKKAYDDIGSVYFFTDTEINPHEELQNLKNQINNKIEGLKRLKGKLGLLRTNELQPDSNYQNHFHEKSNQIFVVHGHDEVAKSQTARFLEKLGFEPIILHEQASSGSTIIEKIEEYANVGFGLILYTPCDVGSKKGETHNLKARARQNVVFEHGYLIGKIGRKNVCALVKGDLETPNDISGVVYVSMDNEGAWNIKIAKELKKNGFNVDMNKL